MSKTANVPSSFRDPSGFLFIHERTLYRQVNNSYREDFDQLIGSGLYKRLVKEGLMIPFKKVSLGLAQTKDAYQVVQPQVVGFISYPYEWCFSELKDAALLTLGIQKIALEHGMSLKDASVYNVQFVKGRPVLIDHLSFEKYEEKPWVAYRQFCQHFLAPLALAAHKDIRLVQLLRIYVDGIPLDLAEKLLPTKAKLNPLLLAHIYLHVKSQQFFAARPVSLSKFKPFGFKSYRMLSLINGLESAVNGLRWEPKGTEWGDYYDSTNYSRKAFGEKKKMVEKFLKIARPKLVWDLGANTGIFSRLAAERGMRTISFDVDPAAVEKNYRQVVSDGETKLLPLVSDLTNPSGGIGWANRERMSLLERGAPPPGGGVPPTAGADTVMALALIHHLAIGNNLPFRMIAEFFAKICHFLIVEFVPKEDSQVQRLLTTREDIFDRYTRGDFEWEFGNFFTILETKEIGGSQRILYLMKNKDER